MVPWPCLRQSAFWLLFRVWKAVQHILGGGLCWSSRRYGTLRQRYIPSGLLQQPVSHMFALRWPFLGISTHPHQPMQHIWTRLSEAQRQCSFVLRTTTSFFLERLLLVHKYGLEQELERELLYISASIFKLGRLTYRSKISLLSASEID